MKSFADGLTICTVSRGLLRRARLAAINELLPDLSAVGDRALSLSPETLSLNFGAEDYTPIASVCFHDCIHTLAEARHALFEYFAHRAFYRERRKPNEATATFFEKYYLDDCALRLYACGEHIANAIILMLNLREDELSSYRQRHGSSQSTIGNFLWKTRRTDPVAEATHRLAISESWRHALNYRNRLVHEQPPSLAGLGISYRRRLRWEVSSDGTKRRLALTLGDPPEYETLSIAEHLLSATTALVTCVTDIMETYFAILERHGIRRTSGGLEIDRRPAFLGKLFE
jgi:hypothetical protein